MPQLWFYDPTAKLTTDKVKGGKVYGLFHSLTFLKNLTQAEPSKSL